MKAWRKRNPDKVRAALRRQYTKAKKNHRLYLSWFYFNHLRREYGKKAADHYIKCIRKQKGLCSICKRKMKPPCMDHSHHTGKLRELLCIGCNVLVGQLEHRLAKQAARYIARHKRGYKQ